MQEKPLIIKYNARGAGKTASIEKSIGDVIPINVDCKGKIIKQKRPRAEYEKVPADKVEEFKDYARMLHRKFPHMSQDRLARKAAEYFHIKRFVVMEIKLPIQTQMFGDEPTMLERGANFSPCRKYRFSLWRIWDKQLPYVMFVGLNPSTANEDKDDATIRRVIAFARKWHFGGVYMMNCFPFVSTNPDDLKDCSRLEENDRYLDTIGTDVCSEVIFAWGNFDIVIAKGRDEVLTKMFPDAKCLVKNKNGSPRHPLYVPYNIELLKW